ncbi:hypothetical protein [Candidatus Trichorickettsia mobilis]|uniref:hypothetical protein n=1 Tax=Candidatus Trichorickettsia mobilis TaxID=1346319 RepID=UPI00292DBDC7|nr:hypothetical protein [Candidatus Trichorickettsia mobilis]
MCFGRHIDAPKIEYRNADISPSIEKVINNIHTKFEHQGQLIENIVTRLQKFLGQNKLITEIIEYGLGKHQIYIGTNDIPGVGIDTAGVTSRNDYFITIKRADELASSMTLIYLFA